MKNNTTVHPSSKAGKGKGRKTAVEIYKAMMWLRGMDITLPEYDVLTALIGRLNGSGQFIVWPSQETIRKDLKKGRSIATIKRAIASLKKAGHLSVSLRNASGGRKSNVYHLHVSPQLTGDLSGQEAHSSNQHSPQLKSEVPTAHLGVAHSSLEGHKEETLIEDETTEEETVKIAGKPQNHGYASQDQNPDQGIITPGELAEVWKQLLTEHHDGASFLPGKQEMGQLGNLIDHLGVDTVPVVQHVLAIQDMEGYVIRNWPDFIKDVEKSTTAFKCPTQPDVGFLLKYRAIALDMYRASVKAAEQAAKWKVEQKAKEAAQQAKEAAQQAKEATEKEAKAKSKLEAEQAKKEAQEATEAALLSLAKQQGFDMDIVQQDLPAALAQFKGCTTLEEIMHRGDHLVFAVDSLWSQWRLICDLREADTTVYDELIALPKAERREIVRSACGVKAVNESMGKAFDPVGIVQLFLKENKKKSA